MRYLTQKSSQIAFAGHIGHNTLRKRRHRNTLKSTGEVLYIPDMAGPLTLYIVKPIIIGYNRTDLADGM